MSSKSLYGIASSIIVIMSILASLLSIPLASAQLPLPPGVPRGDVLVLGTPWGVQADPTDFNDRVVGKPSGPRGYIHLCSLPLSYINLTNGELVHMLAKKVDFVDNYTRIVIYLRDDVYWSDGVKFTADDVVFTIQLQMNNPQLVGYPIAQEYIKSIRKIDDYTVEIILKKPDPRFYYWQFANQWRPTFYPLPKHIWEGKDPVSFKFYPPVCTGPYTLEAYDPAGTWWLWKRNEDWWATKALGWKPSPKYVLIKYFSTEESKALAMVRHELDADWITQPEAFDIVLKGDPYIAGFRRTPPYAFPWDCARVVAFNLYMYPYNVTEVRKALAFAINFTRVRAAASGPDGSAPTPTVLPVLPTPRNWELYYQPLKDYLIQAGMDPNTWWWKYDPAYAEQLLKSVGFTRGPDGKWRLPDGTPWKITLVTSVAPADVTRYAYYIAEEWRNFGVDVTVSELETGPYYLQALKTGPSTGVMIYWYSCALLPDLGLYVSGWHSRFYDPNAPACTGTLCGYNFTQRKELDNLIDTLWTLSPTEQFDKVVEISREILKIWVNAFPWISLFPTAVYNIYEVYCWDGWPSYPENYYNDARYWWPQVFWSILHLYPTGRCPTKEAIPVPGIKYAEYAGMKPTTTTTAIPPQVTTTTTPSAVTQTMAPTVVTVTSPVLVTVPTPVTAAPEISGTLSTLTTLSMIMIILLVIVTVLSVLSILSLRRKT